MGVKSLLILTNVVLGTLSTSYKCSQIDKTSVQLAAPASSGLGTLRASYACSQKAMTI